MNVIFNHRNVELPQTRDTNIGLCKSSYGSDTVDLRLPPKSQRSTALACRHAVHSRPGIPAHLWHTFSLSWFLPKLEALSPFFMLQFTCVQSCIKINCAQSSLSVAPKLSEINKTDLCYLSLYFLRCLAQSSHPVIFVEVNAKVNSVAETSEVENN